MVEWVRMNWPAALSVFGALIAAIGAFFATQQQGQQQVAYEKLLRQRTDEIVDLNKKLADKSDNIAAMTQTSLDAVTGGDTFCYLELSDSLETGTVVFHVSVEGKHPLFDVTMTVTDQNAMAGVMHEFEKRNAGKPFQPVFEVLGRHAFDGTRRTFALGNLNPSTWNTVPDMVWPVGGLTDRGFLIQTVARNGYIIQQTQLRKVDGQWISATQVTKNDGSTTKTVYSVVNDKFPRKPDGSVDWGKLSPLPHKLFGATK
jgi:hypothetical protein